MKGLSWLVQFEDFDWNTVPRNAILYSTHTEIYFTCWNPKFRLGKANGVFTVGFHGLTPYLWIPWHTLAGVSWEIYTRCDREKPFDQVIRLIEARPEERLFIFTDAGGPYGKVRGSLIKLSEKTGRPLIAFRHSCTHSITILKHHIPLPLSKVTAAFSLPLSVQKLKEFSEPLQEIQRAFDRVPSFYSAEK